MHDKSHSQLVFAVLNITDWTNTMPFVSVVPALHLFSQMFTGTIAQELKSDSIHPRETQIKSIYIVSETVAVVERSH